MKTMLTVMSLICAASPAVAQYYGDRPPPPPPPGYYRPPPPPPGYYPQREQFGRHCEAFLRTQYGPRRLFCPIVEAKPLGEECACPPPEGYPPEPFIGGRTVR